jgi:hypothetical protein
MFERRSKRAAPKAEPGAPPSGWAQHRGADELVA